MDGLNFKFKPFVYSSDGDFGQALTGAVSFPIGDNFGVQVDGLLASSDATLESSTRGAAIHSFWRDPTVGLLGVYGDFMEIDQSTYVSAYSGALEAAIYWDRFTIEGIAGLKETNFTDANFFSAVRGGFYLDDNALLSFGHTYDDIVGNSLFLQGEWATYQSKGFSQSLFASSSVNEDSDFEISMGVTLYFGNSDKSLKRRHREDDPNIWIPIIPYGPAVLNAIKKKIDQGAFNFCQTHPKCP